jgi:hypothetical protein
MAIYAKSKNKLKSIYKPPFDRFKLENEAYG